MARRLLSIALLALIAFSTIQPAPRPAEAQVGGCVFTLGFATLREMILAQYGDIVGQCLENEWHNAFNGDALQQTTGGLMVWRKADNWTAFTNGYLTWVNGPCGLQWRPNAKRFPWEQGEAARCESNELLELPSPSPTPAPVAPSVAPTSPPVPLPALSAHAGTRADPVPLGETALVTGNWALAVVSVSPDATGAVLGFSASNRPPAPGAQFFLARISVTNVGQGARRFGAQARLFALGRNSVVHPSRDASCGSVPQRIADDAVPAGATISGNLCWQVLSTEAGTLLLFDRTGLTASVGPFFALY